MEEYIPYILVAYFAAISLISFAVCVYDKWASKHDTRHRVRESTIFAYCWLGGALATFITMKLIRHKTLHKKFMIGIPLIIILQIILIIAAMNFETILKLFA